MERVGARLWIARIMITWGLLSRRHRVRVEPDQPLRAALPARRRGSRLLPRHDPVSDVLVSGCLARADRERVHDRAADLHRHRQPGLRLRCCRWTAYGLHGWQWMFLLEGIPAVLCGVAVLAVLRDGPAKAAWLDRRRTELAAERAGGERAAHGTASHSSLCSAARAARLVPRARLLRDARRHVRRRFLAAADREETGQPVELRSRAGHRPALRGRGTDHVSVGSSLRPHARAHLAHCAAGIRRRSWAWR